MKLDNKMKKVLVLCCMVCLMISCGSKKEFTRSDSVENLNITEQLHADLYRETKLLELLDIKIRKIETIDSSGNVRIETNVDVSKKTDSKDLDSTKITATKQAEGDKTINQNSRKERSGVMGDWVWIVGFLTLIGGTLMVGVYILKK